MVPISSRKSPAHGHFEFSGFSAVRPGKRAFFMPEQLTFDQRVEWPAMDFYKRFVKPLAVPVNQPGCHAFARAGIAEQQHGGNGGSHGPDVFMHFFMCRFWETRSISPGPRLNTSISFMGVPCKQYLNDRFHRRETVFNPDKSINSPNRFCQLLIAGTFWCACGDQAASPGLER